VLAGCDDWLPGLWGGGLQRELRHLHVQRGDQSSIKVWCSDDDTSSVYFQPLTGGACNNNMGANSTSTLSWVPVPACMMSNATTTTMRTMTATTTMTMAATVGAGNVVTPGVAVLGALVVAALA